jgi:xanthine dehydrogenase accessory factor
MSAKAHQSANTSPVLIRGSDDIGSAVAFVLFRAGYAVAIHDISQPATTRRKMAFTDAIFEGCAWLEGVEARSVDNFTRLLKLLAARQVIPIIILDLTSVLEAMAPDILIDARLRKRYQPEVQRGLAQLTIGLGPNFVAGQTTDLAIETSWGDELGRVIEQGMTRPLAGEPREIAGHGRDRYVYAPEAGLFHTTFEIGDPVSEGQVVAYIDSYPLPAPLDGVVRGLTHEGVPVSIGTKVIEVDPRGAVAVISGLSERPGRIAAGVLQAVESRKKSALKG